MAANESPADAVSVMFETVPSRQAEIPPTDRVHYITGIYALNVPSPEGTSGDWHDVFHWREGVERPRTVRLGGSEWVDTNPLLGDLGVYDGRAQLAAMGLDLPAEPGAVYVANHFRAILDVLYRSLSRYEAVLNLTGATDDWLDTPEQKDQLLGYATRLSPVLSAKSKAALESWIAVEREGTH